MCFAFSPDSSSLVVFNLCAMPSGTLEFFAPSEARLFSARTGKPFGLIIKHIGPMNTRFSPDGTRIVSSFGFCGNWDAKTGAKLVTPYMQSISFDPDEASLWNVDPLRSFRSLEQACIDNARGRMVIDKAFQERASDYIAWKELQYRWYAAIQGLQRNDSYAVAFHLPWLQSHDPNNTIWREIEQEK